MVIIPNQIIGQIYKHGNREFPFEACGYLAGCDNKVLKSYPMRNVDKSREHFSFDPKEQFEALKEFRKEGLDILAVYHTHPDTPARPSAEDIKLAYDPSILYVIVSLKAKGSLIGVYRVIKGKAVEVELIIGD